MTKERLKQYRALKLEAQQIKEELEHLEDEVRALPASKQEARLRTLIDRLTDAYCSRLEELTAEQLEIEEAMDQLDCVERTILRDYYINGLTWKEVSSKNHYEWAHLHRIHANALKALDPRKK